jgi:beta-lactamase class A
MNRRDVLCSTLALLAAPALAQRAPIIALTDYERDSGGHVGLCAENLRTGAKIVWRDHERFVMCSTFKASLAACILASVAISKSAFMPKRSSSPGRILVNAA